MAIMTQPAPPIGEPAADVEIGESLIRGLLAVQHPDLAHMALRLVANGWDNVMYRLGDELALRLPRRAMAAPLLSIEHTWLPQIAPTLPLPVPACLRMGEPQGDYPFRWMVVPWLEGEPADMQKLAPGQGAVLGRFLKALHQPAPEGAPYNPYRSAPLSSREQRFGDLIAQFSTGPYAPLIGELAPLWPPAMTAPVDVNLTWIHSDLHPRNVLVQDGAFSAVIDWGDMCRGDRAIDFVSLYTLMPNRAQADACLAAYGPVSEQTLVRARGWTLGYTLMLLQSGLSNAPHMKPIAERTLQRLREGP